MIMFPACKTFEVTLGDSSSGKLIILPNFTSDSDGVGCDVHYFVNSLTRENVNLIPYSILRIPHFFELVKLFIHKELLSLPTSTVNKQVINSPLIIIKNREIQRIVIILYTLTVSGRTIERVSVIIIDNCYFAFY